MKQPQMQHGRKINAAQQESAWQRIAKAAAEAGWHRMAKTRHKQATTKVNTKASVSKHVVTTNNNKNGTTQQNEQSISKTLH